MIGVGVYVGGFYSLLSLKDARLVLLVWLIGGLHAICGAIAYGAIANRLPVSGGEYTYLTRCVHPAVGFVAGWISIVAGFTAPIAATALLLGTYIGGMDSTFTSTKAIATASILFVSVLHCMHLKVGAWFNNAIIFTKLLCFAVFLFIGIPYAMQSSNTGLLVEAGATPATAVSLGARLAEPNTWLQMAISLFYVSLAYTGFNASIYLAGEIEGPTTSGSTATGSNNRKLVSRSMLFASILVVVLYLLLNYVFMYGISPDRIAEAGEGYVAEIARNIGGPWLSGMIRTAIILSASTSILAMLAIGPMVYAQMAEDGLLPKWLRASEQVPRTAIVLQAMLSIVVVWISQIQDIVKYLGLTLTACGALAVSSVWIARRFLSGQSPIKIYEHIAAAVYVGGAVALLLVAGSVERERNQFYLCVGTFALGIVIFSMSRLRKR